MVAVQICTIIYTSNDHSCMTVAPYPPPDKVSISLVDLSSRRLTFIWSSVAPDCPTIHYNILSSNCGSCPTTTTYTTVTCTDVPTDGDMCTLALETVVCGNVTGNLSDIVQGILKGIIHCVINDHNFFIS